MRSGDEFDDDAGGFYADNIPSGSLHIPGLVRRGSADSLKDAMSVTPGSRGSWGGSVSGGVTPPADPIDAPVVHPRSLLARLTGAIFGRASSSSASAVTRPRNGSEMDTAEAHLAQVRGADAIVAPAP
jgi:hypothetical protein